MVMKSAPANPDPNPNWEELKLKGVRKRKWGKWVSEIRLPNSRERIWLGSYDSPIKAARAFDAAQLCLRGPSAANLNFPDDPPRIDGAGKGLTPAEIQLAATTFANAEEDHRPPPVAAEEASTCSVSVSDGAVESESSADVSSDSGAGSVLDYCCDFDTLEILGSGNFDASFGLETGLGDFCTPLHSDISSDYFEYDNWNGSVCDDSFLWSF